MTNLLTRLESAEVGNRKLDFAIGCELGIDGCVQLDDGTWDHILPGTWPAYTTSLDAALTLVPEGAVWHVMTDYGGLNRAKIGPKGRPSASVYDAGEVDHPTFIQEDAATPALALCIAALRARG